MYLRIRITILQYNIQVEEEQIFMIKIYNVNVVQYFKGYEYYSECRRKYIAVCYCYVSENDKN